MNIPNPTKSALHRLMWITNVKQFFPDKSPEEYWDSYQQWNRNRTDYAALYRYFDLLRLRSERPDSPAGLFQNGILISFHYGPYRLLPRYLIALGIRLSILASADVIARERDWYVNELQKANIPTDTLEFLDAGAAMVFRKIIQANASGRLVLVYLDANEGQLNAQYAQSVDKIKIPFGAHHFYWRSNLLKFALRLGINVGVGYLKMDANGQNWQIDRITSLWDSRTTDDKWKAVHALETLQCTFQQMIRQDWRAWENWAYIHVYNDDEQPAPAALSAKGSWFVPFSIRDKGYLYDIESRQFFEVLSKK
ncbi:hypothetical protein [Sphingobacterium tabacisoli]|uniref:Lipid A biosynthesis acyltransferase n=1 Tax=Sphingobacterium tabacisoli TaxID=2044855 RepID=A0ABW5L7C3_9SPHI|nr:hypothetical protein [Sphingobacterium tabacisoli]